jgi:hypothetical protein
MTNRMTNKIPWLITAASAAIILLCVVLTFLES